MSVHLAACAHYVHLDGGSRGGRAVIVDAKGIGSVDLYHDLSNVGHDGIRFVILRDTVAITQIHNRRAAIDTVVKRVARLQIKGKEIVVGAGVNAGPAVGSLVGGGVFVLGYGRGILIGDLLGTAWYRYAARSRSYHVELDGNRTIRPILKGVGAICRCGQGTRERGDRLISQHVMFDNFAACKIKQIDVVRGHSRELIVHHVSRLQHKVDRRVIAIHVNHGRPAIDGIVGGGVFFVGIWRGILIGDLLGILGDLGTVHDFPEGEAVVSGVARIVDFGSVQMKDGSGIYLVALGGDELDTDVVEEAVFEYRILRHRRPTVGTGLPRDRYAVMSVIGKGSRKVGLLSKHGNVKGDVDLGQKDLFHFLIGCLDRYLACGHGKGGFGIVGIGKSDRSADDDPLVKDMICRSCARRQSDRCSCGGSRVRCRTVRNGDVVKNVLEYRTDHDGFLANCKICTLLTSRIVDGNTTCDNLPMREGLTLGSIIANQLYVVIVHLTCDHVFASVYCMAALYRDRNENIQACALTTIKTVGAAPKVVECDVGIAIESIPFRCCDTEANSISFAIYEYTFGRQVLIGGIAIPIVNRCRVFFGVCGSDNVGGMLSVCRCYNSELHCFKQNLVGIGRLNGNCLTHHDEGGCLLSGISKGHTACRALPARKILAVGGFSYRNGDRLTATRKRNICLTALDGDVIRSIAVDRLDADVACGHDEGGRTCGCIHEEYVLAADDLPALERLARVGCVCRQSHGHASACLGHGRSVNRRRTAVNYNVVGLACLHDKLQVITAGGMSSCDGAAHIIRRLGAVDEHH